MEKTARVALKWWPAGTLAMVLVVAANPSLVGVTLSAIVLVGISPFVISKAVRCFGFPQGFGLETILLLLVPSYLAHMHWLAPETVEQARVIVERAELIPVFVTAVIVGSLAAMERRAMFSSLSRIGPLLALSNLIAVCFALLVAAFLGISFADAMLFMIVPALSGGVSAGVLPLSLAYGHLWNVPPDELVARLMSPVIVANLIAIVLAGAMRPADRSTGTTDEVLSQSKAVSVRSSWRSVFAAVLLIVLCHFVGKALEDRTGLPAPVVTIVVVLSLQASGLLIADTRMALTGVYRFVVSALTYPVLFIVGLLLMPWESLVSGITTEGIVVIVALVAALAVSGWFLGPRLSLLPFDASVLTTTRAAMGGTGDVGILSAAGRMELMALAQISTRLGGAVVVACALGIAGLFNP